MANKPSSSKINEKNINDVEKETLNKANKALSALEIALASWDAAEPKPEHLQSKFTKFRRLHAALEDWEKKMLISSKHNEEFSRRIERLYDFVRICNFYG